MRPFGERDDATPHEAQADLVAHFGVTTEGFYLTTLTRVDVATNCLLAAQVLEAERCAALDAQSRALDPAARSPSPTAAGRGPR